MARGSRRVIQSSAKVTRIKGEPVWLLIPATQAASTSTPFSISSADTSVDLTTAQKVRMYAIVHRKPGQFVYGEGGKTVKRAATVEISADYADTVQACYAVQFMDDSILIKKTENPNDSGTMWVLEVESHVNDK